MRLHVHCELPLPAAGAYMHEAEEIEGFGFLPLLPRVSCCISPEFDQPRLLRVQSQTVFLEPSRQDLNTFSASSLCWKHKMASSAKRIS